ncbi:MAG: MBL fold metallo-hydrolase [Desulfomonilaceae bacterium]|nr:MBL fold metallo-hydrolase [Desulfomonilaceae bacterium]
MTRRDIDTRITVLVDNNVRPDLGLLAEHGFSALIERGPDRILFDTGQGQALPWNAGILGVDLAGIDTVVLSHGHYDHTGGLPHVVRHNPGVRVVVHPKALEPHLALKENESVPHDVGIPYRPTVVEKAGARFDLKTEFAEIAGGVFYTGYVPRILAAEPDKRLLVPGRGGWRPDLMEDDVSLLLDTPSGWVVCFGCAHAGVRNILHHLKDHLEITSIWGVLGGTHLGFAAESETFAVIEVLESFRVQFVATAHCTGAGPNRILKNHFGDRFHAAHAGAVFEF